MYCTNLTSIYWDKKSNFIVDIVAFYYSGCHIIKNDLKMPGTCLILFYAACI